MPEDKNLYPEDGKKFQKTWVKTVFISSFSENWQQKKHPLKYELPSIPPKKVMILSIHILYRIEIKI